MTDFSLLTCDVCAVTDLCDGAFDGVILVAPPDAACPKILQNAIDVYKQIDSDASGGVCVLKCDELPSKRLVYCCTGKLDRDYDDVRRFYDAAKKATERALKAGCKKPLLVCPGFESFEKAQTVALLGALEAVYVPLEIREAKPEKATKVSCVGFWHESETVANEVIAVAKYLEQGRSVARDIGGSDPERMAPPMVHDYVVKLFASTCVKVTVISDPEVIEKEYPMMAAVNRATKGIKRHEGCVIFLEYVGEGTIDKTLMLVGKGVTFDTGGVNVKTGGAMFSMHRDKCGSAFVAGFFQVLAKYKPKNLKVCGVMCMVRNSIGEEAYICDEIITSRAGKRCRIVNTDAEGRMAMCDLLCQFKDQALTEVNPEIFTIATLTGHVIRAYGDNYFAICQNGPAEKSHVGTNLREAGEKMADPSEISHLRREDYEHHKGLTEYEDLMQSGPHPSTMTARGHMTPAAFLIMASGLDKHGLDSKQQLKYSHLDVAGSAGFYPGPATGSPVIAMASQYILPRAMGK